MRVFCLVVVLVLVVRLTSPAAPIGKPWVETGVVAASSPDTAAHNGLPNIVATPSGKLIAAWSAWSSGPKSKLRIVTAQSGDGGKTWSSPVTRIDNPGKTDADANFVVDGARILLLSTTVPEPGRIIRTETWLTISGDDGETWSAPAPVRQPRKYTVGKVHVGHRLPDGRLAIGYSWDIFCEQDMAPHTEGEMDLKSGFMFSSDGGRSWRAGGDIYARPPKMTPYSTNGLDEPANVVLDGGEVYALLRSGTTRLWEARSKDWGETWSEPLPSPLTGHNAPAALWRLRGAKDVVVVWNNSPRNRYPLAAALSQDGCYSWSRAKVIAASPDRQASYPSVAEGPEGVLIAVWQQDLADRQGREIRYARFNKAWLLSE